MKESSPLDFLARAQEDTKLNARILAAVVKGNMVTADEIIQIAQEWGYLFTQYEFQEAIKRHFAEMFKKDEEESGQPQESSPQSSCAYGCLSYTKSWHPTMEAG